MAYSTARISSAMRLDVLLCAALFLGSCGIYAVPAAARDLDAREPQPLFGERELADPADWPVLPSPEPGDVLANTIPIPVEPPRLDTMADPGPDAHCIYVQSEGVPVMFTERVTDGQVTMERAYARIDGLLRELRFVARQPKKDGFSASYRTWGGDGVNLVLEVAGQERTKSSTVQDGAIRLSQGNLQTLTGISGTCAPSAANRRAKR